MKGFIELTHYNTDEKFTISLHVIGAFQAASTRAGAGYTKLTVAFGGNDKEDLSVKESYADVQQLITAAQ